MSAVTIVTGAGGALGSKVTEVLLERGHKVAGTDRRLDAIQPLVAQGTCLAIELDVSSSAAWSAALSRIDRDLGALTGAVLCVGGWAGGDPVHGERDEDTWRRMFDANLETAQRSLRAILPGMVERKAGSIVVIGSRAVERPWEGTGAAAYAAAKSALVAYARAIAAEVLDHGVRINAVLPSTIDTKANRAAMPDADAGRWVPTDSLAKVIAFLLSDDSTAVSGAAIPVYAKG